MQTATTAADSRSQGELVAALRSPPGDAAGTVRHVPIASLRRSYARLRPGALPPRCDQGADLPVRVAMTSDGGYEILDGFKRVDRWHKQGHGLAPVVIEPTESAVEHKRLLLCANAPARTLTAMDEARVVCSLVHEDKISPRTAAHLLGRQARLGGAAPGAGRAAVT